MRCHCISVRCNHLLSCLILFIFESCVKCSLQYNLLSFSANSWPFSKRHSHTTHAKQLMWYTWPAVLITNSLDGIDSPQLLHFVPNNLPEKWDRKWGQLIPFVIVLHVQLREISGGGGGEGGRIRSKTYRPDYTCNFCCDFQCDFLLLTDVKNVNFLLLTNVNRVALTFTTAWRRQCEKSCLNHVWSCFSKDSSALNSKNCTSLHR